MNQLLNDLREIRTLLTPKRHWTKGAIARNERGDRVVAKDPSAECWCLVGAMSRVCGHADPERSRAAGQAIARHIPDRLGPISFNDDDATSHADVLALIDRAIASAASMPA